MRLVFETILHTVVFPGSVLVAVPYVLLSSRPDPFAVSDLPLRVLGGLSVLAGIVLGLWCTPQFGVLGSGTPNHANPPRFLVGVGPYRIVRNPMYVAVGLMLAGEALTFGSISLLAYVVLMALVCHVVVVFSEEPTLRRAFGPAYEEYCRRVPRWIPSRRLTHD